jgi:hypothetical protein
MPCIDKFNIYKLWDVRTVQQGKTGSQKAVKTMGHAEPTAAIN